MSQVPHCIDDGPQALYLYAITMVTHGLGAYDLPTRNA